MERAVSTMEARTKKERELRDYLIERIEKEIPYCRLNGDRTKRLPNNVNFSFRFIEGESLLIMLDMKGICASSGSAIHQVLRIRPMCFWRSDCRMRSHIGSSADDIERRDGQEDPGLCR